MYLLLQQKKTPKAMAQQMAERHILVMPSVFAGLTETNLGLLTTVEPRDSGALTIGIEQTIVLRQVTAP